MISADRLKILADAAAELQNLARRFADRQNQQSTLTAGEATKITTVSLNAGNLFSDLVRDLRAEYGVPTPPAAGPPSTTGTADAPPSLSTMDGK